MMSFSAKKKQKQQHYTITRKKKKTADKIFMSAAATYRLPYFGETF